METFISVTPRGGSLERPLYFNKFEIFFFNQCLKLKFISIDLNYISIISV